MSNYTTKVDLKNWASVDTSDFAKKSDLTNLKSDVNKSDNDTLKNVPINLSNLKNKVDKLVPIPADLCKINNIVKEEVYNAKIKIIENKTPDSTNLATSTAFNAKMNEVKNEMSSVTNWDATVAFNPKINEVKKKIPNVTNIATTTAVTAI